MHRFLLVAATTLSITFTTKVLAANSQCEAPATWFPKTPTVSSDFGLPNGTECDFYKWAYQSFLWLTQSEKSGAVPQFLSFTTPDELFGRTTPGFVAPNMKKSKKLLNLAPRIAVQRDVRSVGEVLQAGSEGLLIDKNGRAVYYAQHINQAFVEFVNNENFTDLDKLFNFPADKMFPGAVLELKTAWKIMGQGDDVSKFFTTQAELPSLGLENGKVVTDPKKPITETVGLVGFHVVGTIKDHPEFIWATFEHVDNAPDLEKNTQPLEPVSSRDWTFYPRHTLMNDSNKNPAESITLQPNTQQLAPVTPIFRHFAFGGEKDPSEINDLNRSVHRQLPKELSVWKNYFFTGAVWIDKPVDSFKEDREYPNDDTKLAGEKQLSNTTMETYTQFGQQHCFRCHDTKSEKKTINGIRVEFPAKRINVSHILKNAWFRGQERRP